MEDLAEDRAAGRFNPVLVTGLDPAQVRQVCDDAVLGVRLALAEVELDDDALVHLLLVHELPRAVERAFTAAQQPGVPDLPPQWKTPQRAARPGRRRAGRPPPRPARHRRRHRVPGRARGLRRRAGAAAATTHGTARTATAVAGRAAGAATAASAGATAATAAATADAGASALSGSVGVNRARPGLATT